MANEKIGGAKNIQNYDLVVEDVNYDSENEEWDNKNPPQMIVHDSNNSSNEESNIKSNYEDNSGFKPMFVPPGACTSATTPISDPKNQNEENIAPESTSPQLGCRKCQQFQQTQYKPQTAEYTEKKSPTSREL